MEFGQRYALGSERLLGIGQRKEKLAGVVESGESAFWPRRPKGTTCSGGYRGTGLGSLVPTQCLPEEA